MITPADIKKQIANNEKNHTAELRYLRIEYNADRTRLTERTKNKTAELKCYQKDVDALGGFIEKHEAMNALGVSRQRFETLVNRREFRIHDGFYSLADVKNYKKNRKPGRPWDKVKVARPRAAAALASNG